MARRSPSKRAPRETHRLRIVGGEWRSRHVPITTASGLRPTPDRVRETLFNWLAPRIEGSRCLDAFAGTGALGLEALSRGAAHVSFIDNDPAATAAIRDALDTLGGAERARVTTGDALAPSAADGVFDIVFLDPPFVAHLHAPAIDTLRTRLAPNARLYVEYPAAARPHIEQLLADGFEILRAKRAGAVGYCLAQPGARGEDSAP